MEAMAGTDVLSFPRHGSKMTVKISSDEITIETTHEPAKPSLDTSSGLASIPEDREVALENGLNFYSRIMKLNEFQSDDYGNMGRKGVTMSIDGLSYYGSAEVMSVDGSSYYGRADVMSLDGSSYGRSGHAATRDEGVDTSRQTLLEDEMDVQMLDNHDLEAEENPEEVARRNQLRLESMKVWWKWCSDKESEEGSSDPAKNDLGYRGLHIINSEVHRYILELVMEIEVYGESHDQVWRTQTRLAIALEKAGNLERALDLHKSALLRLESQDRLLEAALKAQYIRKLLQKMGGREEAELMMARAGRLLDDYDCSTKAYNRATSLEEEGQYHQAMKLYARAITQHEARGDIDAATRVANHIKAMLELNLKKRRQNSHLTQPASEDTEIYEALQRSKVMRLVWRNGA